MTDALFDAAPATARSAILSPCGTYRYELTRRWSDRPLAGWVMPNPSTADAEVDDPTIRRCVGFAKAWGFGGIVVRNLYALRATDPAELRAHPEPIGPDNAEHLVRAAKDALTICAWGAHGARDDRSRHVAALLEAAGADLRCLALTADGQPRHPLYLRADLTPVAFDLGSAA